MNMRGILCALLFAFTGNVNAFTCYVIKLEGDSFKFKYRVSYARFSNGISGGAFRIYGEKDSDIEFASIRECSAMTVNGFVCNSNRWQDGLKALQVTRKSEGVYLVTATTTPQNGPIKYYFKDQECNVVEGGS
jgi:hypothetical protein